MLHKTYTKNKKSCVVRFVLTASAAGPAKSVYLVGDFNNWNRSEMPLERGEDGSWTGSLKLEAGREYQFRYLIDGERWENDWNADKYLPTPYGDAENSVVLV